MKLVFYDSSTGTERHHLPGILKDDGVVSIESAVGHRGGRCLRRFGSATIDQDIVSSEAAIRRKRPRHVVVLKELLNDNLDEWMSMAHTRIACRKLTPAIGESFVTTLRRPILTLDEDTSPGVHDTLIPCCDAARYRDLGYEGHANCADNMAHGLKELGVDPPPPPAPLNIFMNIPVGPTGRLEIVPPVCEPGDYVVLRAEMDCIIALSACPHDVFPVNGADATPRDIAYAVFPLRGEPG